MLGMMVINDDSDDEGGDDEDEDEDGDVDGRGSRPTSHLHKLLISIFECWALISYYRSVDSYSADHPQPIELKNDTWVPISIPILNNSLFSNQRSILM